MKRAEFFPKHIHTVLDLLGGAGYEACPVGGCVRDTLLGKTPADWDVCTNARPEETAAVFSGFHCIDTGAKHGTITVVIDRRPVEITTYRTEQGYADNRHPDAVSFVSSLEEDLSRRDFSINAMAFRPDGTVVDLFGGQDDLQAGLIRAVGDPESRFREDALRILRGLRFASRLNFTIAPETARAMETCRELLHNIAPERIFTELKGILTGPGAGRMLLAFPRIFFTVLPELRPMEGFGQKSPYHIHDVWTHTAAAVEAAPAEPALRLAMLLHDSGKPETFSVDERGIGHFYGHAKAGMALADKILRRLRCDNATRELVLRLIEYHDMRPPQEKKTARRLLIKLGEDDARRLIACWKADSADRAGDVQEEHRVYIAATEALLEEILREESCFSLKDLAVNGGDILALGVEKGPEVGRILEKLFRLVTEEDYPNERTALLQECKKQISP